MIFPKIISVLLICIFAFSITPSVVFHNLLAKHTDCDIQHHHKQSSELAKAGINCHFDNLVCESSFMNLFTPFNFRSPDIISNLLIVSDQAFYSQHHFYTELRGPPAIV